jgi:YHS domain-containing protein
MHYQLTSDIGDLRRELQGKELKIEILQWSPNAAVILNKAISLMDPFTPQVLLSSKPFDNGVQTLGETKDFCPVFLKHSNNLVKGNPSFSARFLEKTYYFTDEEAKRKFTALPYEYVRQIKIPPPRLIFFGVSGSGKTTILENISKKWNIPILDLTEFCLSNMIESGDITKEIRLALNQGLSVSGDHFKKIMKTLFTQEVC